MSKKQRKKNERQQYNLLATDGELPALFNWETLHKAIAAFTNNARLVAERIIYGAKAMNAGLKVRRRRHPRIKIINPVQRFRRRYGRKGCWKKRV